MMMDISMGSMMIIMSMVQYAVVQLEDAARW